MGSFVPFGGFFSTPSEFKKQVGCTSQSFVRCQACNEKYEQEVADSLKGGPTTSASSYSTSLPWLQQVNVDTDKRLDVAKVSYAQKILVFLFQCMQRHSHVCIHTSRKTEIGYQWLIHGRSKCCTDPQK